MLLQQTEEIFAEFSEDNNMEDADGICDDTEEEVVTEATASDVGSALKVLQSIYAIIAQKHGT